MFLTDIEKVSRLQLIRSQSVGSVLYRKMIQVYGSGENALLVLPEIFKNSKKKKDFKIYPYDLAVAEIELASKNDINIVFLGDDFYPNSLEKLNTASPVLFVKSLNISGLKNINGIGIVGTRNSSITAEKFCFQISNELSNEKFCIVSGMAQGIDSSAHSGALMSKNSFPTVAVLAGGVDVVYPLKNRFLYDSIIEKGGAVISEMPIGTQPSANFFPVRNKIIAGLSRGVIVVEAKSKSGSLITCQYAKEYGRVVMAVPGFPSDERAGGPNLLLKQKIAELVENIVDVKNALININENEVKSEYDIFEVSENLFSVANNDINEIKKIILQKLSKTPIYIDDLFNNLDTQTSLVLRALLELELEDKVCCSSGNYLSLI